MKKKILKVSTLLLIVIGATIYSCKKSNPLIDASSNQESSSDLANSTTNQRRNNTDAEALQIVNDETLTANEKTSALIEFDALGRSVVAKIINDINTYGKFNIELIFQVCKVEDVDLILLANHSYLDDATLSNIIAAQLPIGSGAESVIRTHRPNINMLELNKLKDYDKIISLCDLKMVYAPKSYIIYECSGTSIKFLNPVFRSFVNSVNAGDLDVLSRVRDKDKSEWYLGAKNQSSSTGSDGSTITTITCATPPNNKCMKLVKQASAEKTVTDNTLIDIINDKSLNDYEKGGELSIQDIQSPVMTALIDKYCTFDKFIFEIITTSNKTMDEDNINRIILNNDIPDNLLTNILITSTPLKASSISILGVVRKNLKAEYFAKFDSKSKIISICNSNISVGDNLIISNPKSNTTEILINNIEAFSFVFQPDPTKIDFFRKKKGDTKDTWIYGDQSIVTTNGNTTKVVCIEPPSPKCCMVKTADPK